MNCQSMSTVPCFKSSNEVSDLLLLLDSQVELVVLFVFLLSWLMLLHPPPVPPAIIIEEALFSSLDIESEIICLADSLSD